MQVFADAAFPVGRVDEALASLGDASERALAEANCAYYRGDFESALALIERFPPESPYHLAAFEAAGIAAIASGRFDVFQRVRVELERMAAAEPSRMVELARAVFAVSCFAPEHCPAWLREGDLRALPQGAQFLAWYLYAKYLFGRGETMRMLGVVEASTALFTPGRVTFTQVYLYIIQAVGLLKLREEAAAERALLRAMDMSLADGFITPLAEHVGALCGLAEKCLLAHYPALYEPVLNLNARIGAAWLDMHNKIAHDNVTLVLTRRETQIAQCIKNGLTASEIARQMNLSVASVKKGREACYEKLGISKRDQLKDFVL